MKDSRNSPPWLIHLQERHTELRKSVYSPDYRILTKNVEANSQMKTSVGWDLGGSCAWELLSPRSWGASPPGTHQPGSSLNPALKVLWRLHYLGTNWLSHWPWVIAASARPQFPMRSGVWYWKFQSSNPKVSSPGNQSSSLGVFQKSPHNHKEKHLYRAHYRKYQRVYKLFARNNSDLRPNRYFLL